MASVIFSLPLDGRESRGTQLAPSTNIFLPFTIKQNSPLPSASVVPVFKSFIVLTPKVNSFRASSLPSFKSLAVTR